MGMLEQQFNSAASAAIVHLRGREEALAGFGGTGRRAEWIALVCLHCGVFIRAKWARFMDEHPEELRRGVHARVARGLAGEEAVPGIRGSDGFAASLPGASCRALGAEDMMEHATCLGFPPKPRCDGRPKPGSPGRVSTSKRPMRRVESERARLRRTGLSAAFKEGEPAYPLGPRFAGPRQGLARGGSAPLRSPGRPRSGGVRGRGARPPSLLPVRPAVARHTKDIWRQAAAGVG